MFDVSNWDSDEDAKHIYEFYLEELGSTNDAKTIEELFQGAGIQSHLTKLMHKRCSIM